MRNAALIAVALVIATGTAFAIKGKMEGDTGPVESSNTVKILVAKTDILSGTFIRSDAHFDWVGWPKDNLHASYLKEGTVNPQDFDGAVARANIIAGEPINTARVVKPDEGGFLSAVLAPGSRAISIAINATSGNAGFIFPGDRVDMIPHP